MLKTASLAASIKKTDNSHFSSPNNTSRVASKKKVKMLNKVMQVKKMEIPHVNMSAQRKGL